MVQHFSGNYIPKFRCTLFLVFEKGIRKIVYHLIISFTSLLRVRGIKVTSAVVIKKKRKSENGLKMMSAMENPLSLLSVHPNRFFGAKFKKKRKVDL